MFKKLILGLVVLLTLTSCSKHSEYNKEIIRLKSRIEELEDKVNNLESNYTNHSNSTITTSQNNEHDLQTQNENLIEVKEILLTNDNFYDYFDLVEVDNGNQEINGVKTKSLILKSKLYDEGWIYWDCSYDFVFRIKYLYCPSCDFNKYGTLGGSELYTRSNMNILGEVYQGEWEFESVYGIVRFKNINAVPHYEWNTYSGYRVVQFSNDYNDRFKGRISKIGENYPF